MRLTDNPRRDVPICAGIVVVLTLVFWPVKACGCSKIAAGLGNVRRLASGLLQYADDHDERYPDRDHWRDGIALYVKPGAIRPDPDVPKGVSGHAFNGALSHARQPEHPAMVPMVYDSANPIRNASDLVTSLPHPGRHHGQDDVGYADGHAKGIAVPGGP